MGVVSIVACARSPPPSTKRINNDIGHAVAETHMILIVTLHVSLVIVSLPAPQGWLYVLINYPFISISHTHTMTGY